MSYIREFETMLNLVKTSETRARELTGEDRT